MIKVALPNKGQLFAPTLEILSACGYRLNRTPRSLSVLDRGNGVEFFFLRPGDIPLYVANGILDAGVTGMDFVAEKGVNPTRIVDLNYGASKLCAAVPEESRVKTLADLKALRIATSFPNIVRQLFKGHDRIVELAEEYGVNILARLDDPPDWSRADNSVHNRPPDDFDDYGDFVSAFVGRYKGRITYYQIWNEPNVYPEWGNQPVDASA